MAENPSMPLFPDGVYTSRYYSLRNTKVWKEEHDRKLLFAIARYGAFHFSFTLCGCGFTDPYVCKYRLVLQTVVEQLKCSLP